MRSGYCAVDVTFGRVAAGVFRRESLWAFGIRNVWLRIAAHAVTGWRLVLSGPH